jgi:hypothetical protein
MIPFSEPSRDRTYFISSVDMLGLLDIELMTIFIDPEALVVLFQG